VHHDSFTLAVVARRRRPVAVARRLPAQSLLWAQAGLRLLPGTRLRPERCDTPGSSASAFYYGRLLRKLPSRPKFVETVRTQSIQQRRSANWADLMFSHLFCWNVPPLQRRFDFAFFISNPFASLGFRRDASSGEIAPRRLSLRACRGTRDQCFIQGRRPEVLLPSIPTARSVGG
jgi:hypothetical protein